MATIHIDFDSKIQVEQSDNILIFRKKGAIVREYPVDKKYDIIIDYSVSDDKFTNPNIR